MSAGSLRADIFESVRLLAHGEAVSRESHARDAREGAPTPTGVARAVGGFLVRITTRCAPLALVALGYAQTHQRRPRWEVDSDWSVLQAVLLHALCIAHLNPLGVTTSRVHEALRMPGRRAHLLAQWFRLLPRAIVVALAFVAYQAWFVGPPNSWSGAAWMGVLPFLLVTCASWWRTREPSSPECQLAGRLVRASMGTFLLIVVGFFMYFYTHIEHGQPRVLLYAALPCFLVAGWGLMLVWYGVLGLVSAARTRRAGEFRSWVVATDLLVVALSLGATIPTFLPLLDPAVAQGPVHSQFLTCATGAILLLAPWVALATLRLHASREVPGARPRQETGRERLPEDEERRTRFPSALLRGSAPRGFPAAWAFRRRSAMLPMVPCLLLGFMAFCMWVAILVPDMGWSAMTGVLIYPTYVGFGTSSRLHLLGADLRSQHLLNLRALGLRVGLPAAYFACLFLALIGPTKERWQAAGLVGASVILRAGVVGFWRLARRVRASVRPTPVLVALVVLPVLPPMVGIDAWFRITTPNLTVFYAAVGCAGLVLHLARLDERILRDEMLRDAERGIAT